LPVLAVPVLRTSKPLTPFVPEFAVCKRRLPLEEPVPKPVEMMMVPPEVSEDVPAESMIIPPEPEFPLPTVT
jgi:hypothetical protein